MTNTVVDSVARANSHSKHVSKYSYSQQDTPTSTHARTIKLQRTITFTWVRIRTYSSGGIQGQYPRFSWGCPDSNQGEVKCEALVCSLALANSLRVISLLLPL